MQIQRLQNFYLFLALVLAAASMFMPWWNLGDEAIAPCADPVLLILGWLAAALALTGICLFRNLQRQKLVCALCGIIGFLAVGYGTGRFLLSDDPLLTIGIGFTPMALATLCAIFARNCVIKDQKLLRSADRLR
ncbi:MAG: DUF4293 domain-containing protein [Muribaculaceae bacterium]|nr:DUF4293 domain-containing protein [Muribaculaceae bacterium]